MEDVTAKQVFEFVTDTATLSVFDLQALAHRIGDDPDWWCSSEAELAELNAGNAALVGLGADGAFRGIVSEPGSFVPTYSFVLNCPSGKVFVGAGEETTSDGMEPDCTLGGMLMELAPGSYAFYIAAEGGELRLAWERLSGKASNAFESAIRLMV